MDDENKIYPIGIITQKDAYRLSDISVNQPELSEAAQKYWREKGTLDGFFPEPETWECPFCGDHRYVNTQIQVRACTGCHKIVST